MVHKYLYLIILTFFIKSAFSQGGVSSDNCEWFSRDSLSVTSFRALVKEKYDMLKLEGMPDSFCFCPRFKKYIESNYDSLIRLSERKIDSLNACEIILLVKLSNTIVLAGNFDQEALYSEFVSLIDIIYVKRIVSILEATPTAGFGWYSDKYKIGYAGIPTYLKSSFVLID